MSGGEVAGTVFIVIGVILALALMRGMTAWRFWRKTVAPWLDHETGHSPKDADKD